MRFEINDSLLLLYVIAFILVWLFTRKKQSNRSFRFVTTVIGALTMPAFIPDHGEIVMALPNASLFVVQNKLSWGIGLFFLIVNFMVISKVLGHISRKKAT